MPDKRPFFIIGVPRSGTTLLRDLLSQHSGIALPPEESQFLPDLIRARDSEAGDAAFVALARKIVARSNYAFLMQLRYQVDPSVLVQQLSATNPVDVLRDVILASQPYPADKQAVLWGDKTPNYAWMAEEILQWMPDAKFVYIARDPRDVAISMANAWGKSALRSAMDWRKTESCVDALKRRGVLSGANLHELRYEDLLDDTGGELASICAFLDVGFEVGMLDLPRSSERWGNGTGHAGVKSDNKGAFLLKGDRRFVHVVESICIDLMQLRGYEAKEVLQGSPPRIPSDGSARRAALCDSVRTLGAYIREFGLYDGVRYKLRQRGVRALRRNQA